MYDCDCVENGIEFTEIWMNKNIIRPAIEGGKDEPVDDDVVGV